MVALARQMRRRGEKDYEIMKRREFRKLRNRPDGDLPELSATDLQRSILKDDYYEFVKAMWHTISPEKPVWNWHIKYLCRKVQMMMERVFKGQKKVFDLCVNIPPGSTKSTVLSIMLPAWCWTRMPAFRFIGASYGGDIAQDLSMKTRDVVRSDLYRRLFPEIKWRADQDTKNYFMNTLGGWRFSVGVKGDVTGRHAHLIVVDDPLNPEESYSDADIATSNRWIRETLSSRKVAKAVTPMILVMQRLHQDDPTAQFVARPNVFWVCLPAQLEPNVRPVGLRKKYKNGLLDPKRMPEEVLINERVQGVVYFASQFLQNPVPRGGAMFEVDNLRVRTDAPKMRLVVRAWDKAGVEGGKGAYTAGVKVGVDRDNKVWVLDVIRVRLNTYDREHLILRTARRDGPKCLVVVEQEGGSGGKADAEATVRNLLGYRVKIVKASRETGDKERRATPASSMVNGGNVYLLKARWNREFVEELRYFPASRYKDQVDAFGMGFNEIATPRLRAGAMRTSTEKQREGILQIGLCKPASRRIKTVYKLASRV